MTGMEHAIEQAAQVMWEAPTADFGGVSYRDAHFLARALADAGLLAPASQLRAFARLCVYWGDMTPAAARMLDRIIDGDGRAEK